MVEVVPIIIFVGASGVGKTSLLERVVPQLRAEGYRVGVIKHAAHGFEIDKPGKDSWRLTKAGSDVVLLASPAKVATIQELSEELSLAQLASRLAVEVDIILAEGFKRANGPKIEVYRTGVSQGLLSEPRELLGIVSDVYLPFPVPQFSFEDVQPIVEHIIQFAAKVTGGEIVLAEASPNRVISPWSEVPA